jgi:hypothetical protein
MLLFYQYIIDKIMSDTLLGKRRTPHNSNTTNNRNNPHKKKTRKNAGEETNTNASGAGGAGGASGAGGAGAGARKNTVVNNTKRALKTYKNNMNKKYGPLPNLRPGHFNLKQFKSTFTNGGTFPNVLPPYLSYLALVRELYKKQRMRTGK